MPARERCCCCRCWSSADSRCAPPPSPQVEKRFPNKNAPLLIGCSDGTTYSIDALEILDEAGYSTLVGLKG